MSCGSLVQATCVTWVLVLSLCYIKTEVVSSFEDETGFLCVDIILLENKRYFFKVYRRDPEDNSGWFLVGEQSRIQFISEDEAIQKAKMKYNWIKVLR